MLDYRPKRHWCPVSKGKHFSRGVLRRSSLDSVTRQPSVHTSSPLTYTCQDIYLPWTPTTVQCPPCVFPIFPLSCNFPPPTWPLPGKSTSTGMGRVSETENRTPQRDLRPRESRTCLFRTSRPLNHGGRVYSCPRSGTQYSSLDPRVSDPGFGRYPYWPCRLPLDVIIRKVGPDTTSSSEWPRGLLVSSGLNIGNDWRH